MTTDERLDRIERSLESLTRYLQEFRSETISRLETIDSRLTLLIAGVRVDHTARPKQNGRAL